ncbi:MAG TPA: S-methyl-5-thioribose-1-phosphate isomerase [Candidatus Eremiobacteraceae bacterium]
MRVAPPHIEYVGGILQIIDQTLLPGETVVIKLRTVPKLIEAIRALRIRGAPAIGIAGAYGMCIGAKAASGVARNADDFFKALDEAGAALSAARPTAVNLSWAVAKIVQHARERSDAGESLIRVVTSMEEFARAIHADDIATCRLIGDAGAALLSSGSVVLTHCNTGTLATGGYGTALGIVRSAWRMGVLKNVLVGETRPLLQGARLTVWELGRDGIPYTLITDSMAAHFMQRGEVNAVVVGADRIARNGDFANKIGTYGLAVLANAHSIPLYVAAPRSTFDSAIASGDEINLEQRNPIEVLEFAGVRVAPAGASAFNPAFDVTPGKLVTAFVMESGVLRPPYAQSIASFEFAQVAPA